MLLYLIAICLNLMKEQTPNNVVPINRYLHVQMEEELEVVDLGEETSQAAQ